MVLIGANAASGAIPIQHLLQETTMSDHGIARDQLRAFIERIERLEEEKKAIADDVKEVYAEAKGSGFDTKVMRQIIRIRKQDRNSAPSRRRSSIFTCTRWAWRTRRWITARIEAP